MKFGSDRKTGKKQMLNKVRHKNKCPHLIGTNSSLCVFSKSRQYYFNWCKLLVYLHLIPEPDIQYVCIIGLSKVTVTISTEILNSTDTI